MKGGDRKVAIAAGIRHAYSPLFAANEKANDLTGENLKSLIAQVAGSDDDMTGRIASTFSALAKLGDFSSEVSPAANKKPETNPEKQPDEENAGVKRPDGLRTEFHYNIQVHLPANGTEETYLNIFNAIRKTFQ